MPERAHSMRMTGTTAAWLQLLYALMRPYVLSFSSVVWKRPWPNLEAVSMNLHVFRTAPSRFGANWCCHHLADVAPSLPHKQLQGIDCSICPHALELDLLEGIAAGLGQQRAAQRDGALLGAGHSTLQRRVWGTENEG